MFIFPYFRIFLYIFVYTGTSIKTHRNVCQRASCCMNIINSKSHSSRHQAEFFEMYKIHSLDDNDSILCNKITHILNYEPKANQQYTTDILHQQISNISESRELLVMCNISLYPDMHFRVHEVAAEFVLELVDDECKADYPLDISRSSDNHLSPHFFYIQNKHAFRLNISTDTIPFPFSSPFTKD